MGTVELYKPHPKQLEIHKAIADLPAKYYSVPIGRQFGKTLLGENQALKWGIDNSWKVGWVSPTYKQCKKVYKEIKNAVQGSPILKRSNDSDLIIELLTGGTIVFYSAEAYDGIRGETFDALIMDEFAFYKREAWTEVLKATVLVKGKKVLALSTPRGKNHFFEFNSRHLTDDNYVSIAGSSYDNPFIDRKEIEDARRNLPDHIFRQEYMAEFLEDGSGVFVNVKECIKPAASEGIYAGIDLGRADDYTVLTITDSDNNEIYCERWRHMNWSDIISKVVTNLNKYKAKTYVEANGAQDAIYEQIRDKVNYGKNNIQPFVTTSKSKQSIVEDLIVEFENQEIGILGHDWQLGELEAFAYEYNPRSRQIKYSAPVGLHDDYVMSRAICSRARKDLKSTGVYLIR